MSVRLRLTANRRAWTNFTITTLFVYGKTTSRISRQSKLSRALENIVSCPLRTCALRGYGIKIRRQKTRSRHSSETRFSIFMLFLALNFRHRRSIVLRHMRFVVAFRAVRLFGVGPAHTCFRHFNHRAIQQSHKKPSKSGFLCTVPFLSLYFFTTLSQQQYARNVCN